MQGSTGLVIRWLLIGQIFYSISSDYTIVQNKTVSQIEKIVIVENILRHNITVFTVSVHYTLHRYRQ